MPGEPGDELGAEHARGRPREERPGRMSSRLVDTRDSTRRTHHERLGKPGVRARGREPLQVRGNRRPEIGVDRGRRGALVLAKLRRDLVRRDHAGGGHPAPQLLRDRALVRRIAEREQQADRDGLGVHLCERAEIELLQHALRPDPLAHAEAALERHERLGMVGAQAVEVGPVLSTQVEEMLEARGGDERRPRSLALEQRVRGDRGAVAEAFDV